MFGHCCLVHIKSAQIIFFAQLILFFKVLFIRENGSNTEKHIQKFLNEHYTKSSFDASDPSTLNFYLAFPCFGQFSDKLFSELLALLFEYFKDVRCNILLVNRFKIVFFNYKVKLPMRLKSSLVHKFRCVKCESEYVGMTTRTHGTRVDEHVGVSY